MSSDRLREALEKHEYMNGGCRCREFKLPLYGKKELDEFRERVGDWLPDIRWHYWLEHLFAAITAQPDATAPATFSQMGHPQNLALSEQCCDACGIAFFFLEAKDGDCSTQDVTFCPGCGTPRKIESGDASGHPTREPPPVAPPYKGPIKQPCSACSAGDTAMEHHDHEYVKPEFRTVAPAVPPAQVLSEEQVKSCWRGDQDGYPDFAAMTVAFNATLRSPASTSGKETL